MMWSGAQPEGTSRCCVTSSGLLPGVHGKELVPNVCFSNTLRTVSKHREVPAGGAGIATAEVAADTTGKGVA